MSAIRKLLLVTVIVKLSILLIIFLAYTNFPFFAENYYSVFVYNHEKISLLTAYQTWDAQHYLYLSQEGYKPDNHTNSFYPLYPALIALVSSPFSFADKEIFAGLLISNLLSIGAIFYFYLLVLDITRSEKVAFTSSLFLLAFPTAFYLSLIYTEALCLFLIVCFFYFIRKKHIFIACLCAFLLPLSRPIGFFIFFPALYLFILHLRSNWDKRIVQRIWPEILLPVSAAMGFLCYLLVTYSFTSSPWSGFTAAKGWGWQVNSIFHPLSLISNFFIPHWKSYMTYGIDRGIFIFFLILLPFIYHKLGKLLFIFALLVGSVPIFGSFVSYSRYFLLVFPVFILMGMFFESKKFRVFKYPVLYLMISFQIFLLVLHSLNYWVA